jgi:hypothetical protein
MPTVALIVHAVLNMCFIILPMGLTTFCMLEMYVLVARLETRWGPHR